MKRGNLAYAHANMRLLTRYGFEIDEAEWLDLSAAFPTTAVAQRKNHIGDVEGWIKVRDQWVCAYWSAKTKRIKTFYARPPDFKAAAAPTPKQAAPKPPAAVVRPPAPISDVEAEVVRRVNAIREAERASEDRERRERSAAAVVVREMRTKLKAANIRALEAQQRMGRAQDDVRWFKRQMGEVRSLLGDGFISDAMLLADAVAGLSSSPTEDPEAAAVAIADRIRARRAYLRTSRTPA